MSNIFSLSLNIDQVNVILRQLDAGPHAQVRQLIDVIIQQVQAQQQAVVEDSSKEALQ